MLGRFCELTDFKGFFLLRALDMGACYNSNYLFVLHVGRHHMRDCRVPHLPPVQLFAGTAF
eukprot:5979751-Amphidinium_carterae.1